VPLAEFLRSRAESAELIRFESEGISLMATLAIRLPNGARMNLVRTSPFFLAHLICLAVFFTTFHWSYLAACLGLYFVQIFFRVGYLWYAVVAAHKSTPSRRSHRQDARMNLKRAGGFERPVREIPVVTRVTKNILTKYKPRQAARYDQ